MVTMRSGIPPAPTISLLSLLGLLVAGCGRSVVVSPSPTPTARAPEPSFVPPTVSRLVLAARLPDARWRITTETRLRLIASADPEQRIQTNATVSWRFDRRPDGALRGVGIVEGYRLVAEFLPATGTTSSTTTRTTFGTTTDSLPPRLALDLVLDSVTSRVVTRPPLVNECDRMEAVAAAQARVAAIRVPDGIQVGSRWRDSTVSLSCRNGTPITIYTTSETRVVGIDSTTVRLTRESVIQLRGSGGSAFRAVSVSGTGTGRAQILLRRPEGSLDRLSETTSSRLMLTDTPSGRVPREQRMEQEVTVRVERLPRP